MSGYEPDRSVELLRSNESLREELHSLRQANAELRRKLEVAAIGSAADRETRRAALNLMEDAVEARLAERRENVERQRVEDELREADRRKDEFLATLAHELRNPLAPIRNGLAVLRTQPHPDPVESLHGMIERQVDHMARLVDDLLEVSRITRGRVELRRELVDLASVVRTAVETARPLVEMAHHELQVDLPEETVVLDVDPVRMAQVLSNLLSNAAKYTDDGGQIWLRAQCEGGEVIVRVRDTGMGMAADTLLRIFDLFAQAEQSSTRSRGGLGIGLTLVRSLVELHGGSVRAHSDGLGCGSEFVVTLPAATGEPTPISPLESPPTSLSCRVLVVDDNRDAAASMSMFLSVLGAEVHTAHDGPSALQAVQTHHPAVVLLDIGMPGMDGYEVAKRVRALPEGQHTTLIALTGWGQDEDKRKSREAGLDHHLVKPVELDVLHMLLAKIPA